MTDVKDILGIRDSSGGSGGGAGPVLLGRSKGSQKAGAVEEKKPEWMSREVFDLTRGDRPAAMTPTLAPQVFKERRKLRNKAVRWQRKPFKNSARGEDTLELVHWQKSDEEPTDYYFAKMNKPLKVQEYNEIEYATYFQDPNWSREETDHLCELAKNFDLRWPVILDRYGEEHPKRTVEDLKERYYKIQKKLSQLREQSGAAKLPMANYNYNKALEVERKKQAEVLYHRTKEQIKEIEELLAEYKKIESSQKRKFSAGRRALTLSDSSSAVGVATPDAGADRRKKKAGSAKRPSVGSPVTAPSTGATPSTPSTPFQTLPRVLKKEQRIPGPTTRSLRITTPLNVAVRTGRQVDAMLDELGIPTRPMPTAEVCRLYNELRQNIVRVIEMEAINKKKLYDLELLKNQRDQLLNPSGSSASQ